MRFQFNVLIIHYLVEIKVDADLFICYFEHVLSCRINKILLVDVFIVTDQRLSEPVSLPQRPSRRRVPRAA